ncbi:D-alanyl-D-alanine carboxypeptidase [Candidatus Falkowbacteria bacterium]|jgi:serine-type D-Ala-D-Ala carboxypeptidase (penicillin-binding protein 5/6)|nr:D-alanyl-D-alanine carboxypeptidase [Candidatus Falkowbacteria bacterium]
MKIILINNKYKLIGILVLIATAFFYKATDLITFARNSVEKKYDVYTREISEIPVSKSKLNQQEKLQEEQSPDSVGPVSDSTTSEEPSFDINNLTSKAVYIEDIYTATQLFEKNAERLLLPASTTKIMTALVARDEYHLEDIFTVPNVAEIEGYSVGLFKNEKVSVKDLLKAALIQSSNDAAYTLAISHPEGLEGFVELMNSKAKQLDLKSTFFDNPAGFDAKNQKSSAHDLAIMSKELMKDQFLKEIVGIKETVITDQTNVYKHHLYNTHQLLGVDESVVGIKTGTTEGASEVLITQFERENRNILIVVMGSNDRYKETSQLIDWVFEEFVWLTPTQIIEKS